jgi:hypothetical protein
VRLSARPRIAAYRRSHAPLRRMVYALTCAATFIELTTNIVFSFVLKSMDVRLSMRARKFCTKRSLYFYRPELRSLP